MQRRLDNLSPEDRRVYRRWVGSLALFYGALMILCVGMVASNNLSRNSAAETAAAKPPAENLQTADSRMAVRRPIK